MREIRFRAWDKKDKKMRYPNMPVNGQAMGENDIFLHIAGPIHQHLAGRMIVAEGVKHLKIMQYTGLKDKNGKEICELQILEGKYLLVYDAPNYIFIDISNGDKTKFLDDWGCYEITGEYFGGNTEISENAQRVIDKYL